MDISGSECSSSGCESGWTMYLDQSSFSKNQQIVIEEEEEEEEDLSMVSDASSGPPVHYDDGYNKQKKNKSKKKTNEFGMNQHQYDDTATSLQKVGMNEDASKEENVLEFSQGFSATNFKGKSSFTNNFGFLKSSLAEKPASKQTGGLQGRKWK